MIFKLSQADTEKAKEVMAFLRSFGMTQCLKLFTEQWELLLKQQMETEVVEAKPEVQSPLASQADGIAPSQPLRVLSIKYRVVTSLGTEDDLWQPSGSNFLAPAFPAGAGVPFDAYEEVKRKDSVRLVPTKPYFKEPPPSNLPLDSFNLRVVFESGKTGFEEEKELVISVDSLVAGRYQMLQFLDSAAFSRTVRCMDLKEDREVCLKIIRNSKDFFDQSLDEIKLLKLINASGDADENCVVKMLDFFYFKEHMCIVTELLRDNLYRFSKFNREEETELYFTLPRLQATAKQVLTGLRFLHSLDLIHSDLKPENILIKSYSRCAVKIVDFGSSCFLTDNLSSYVQSRCYRAPEVILGCKYDSGIDIWSLGAILAELATGNVLFENTSLPQMLASIASVCKELPSNMLHEGRNTYHYVTKYGAFYECCENMGLVFHYPVPDTPIKELFGYDDPLYLDFVRSCLTLDHRKRPTAEELLKHPFMHHDYGSAYSEPPPLKKKVAEADGMGTEPQ
uniref:Protein kinase domain-containing protein n=1 Tax=Trypanosoma congolense (strain IL3000) TaxID=1068625 RepID=G0UV48_TRYCI|nr:putative protein kinase [Trypanosoma congolense IL3000]